MNNYWFNSTISKKKKKNKNFLHLKFATKKPLFIVATSNDFSDLRPLHSTPSITLVS